MVFRVVGELTKGGKLLLILDTLIMMKRMMMKRMMMYRMLKSLIQMITEMVVVMEVQEVVVVTILIE
jgi:hypothetical protein